MHFYSLVTVKSQGINSKKPISITIKINLSHTIYFEACLGISLRVEFHHLTPVGRYCCGKRDIVLLCHFVVNADIVFIFHLFDRDRMLLIRVFFLRRCQLHAMTMDHGLSHAVDDVSADRTYVKSGAHHICRHISIDYRISGNQLGQ